MDQLFTLEPSGKLRMLLNRAELRSHSEEYRVLHLEWPFVHRRISLSVVSVNPRLKLPFYPRIDELFEDENDIEALRSTEAQASEFLVAEELNK